MLPPDVLPSELALVRCYYSVGRSVRRLTLHVNAHGGDRSVVESTARDIAFGLSHIQTPDVQWFPIRVDTFDGRLWFYTEPIETAGGLSEPSVSDPYMAMELQTLVSSGKRARHRMYGVPHEMAIDFTGGGLVVVAAAWFAAHILDHGYTGSGRRYIGPSQLRWVAYKGPMVTGHRRPDATARFEQYLWKHGEQAIDSP